MAAIALFVVIQVGSLVEDPGVLLVGFVAYFTFPAPAGLLTWGGLVCLHASRGKGAPAALGVALLFAGIVRFVFIVRTPWWGWQR